MNTPTLSVPTLNGNVTVEFLTGSTLVFIGANGSGKTRLGVWFENNATIDVHRVGAHRSLAMNPEVIAPSLEAAMTAFRYGHSTAHPGHRLNSRWSAKPEVAMLGDFDHVVAALYADENETSVQFRHAHAIDPGVRAVRTKLDILKEIWERLLPHRGLSIRASKISVHAPETSQEYSSSEMSDGERVIFYLLGQALLVPSGTVLIIDEPELHINRAILPKLWDSIEASRKDCAIVYMTHDVEFAASRHAATKYVVRSYAKPPDRWDMALLPETSDIPDDVVVTILGSRVPVLFVEGESGSLDAAVYRRIFDGHTVIPVGGCANVIHSVRAFATHTSLHRVGCAGIVDADARTPADVERLNALNIHVLPVSEIENIFLLPDVFFALAKELNFDHEATLAMHVKLKGIVLSMAKEENNRISLDFTRRRIDAEIKQVGLSAKTISELDDEFSKKIGMVKPATIYTEIQGVLSSAVGRSDYETVLRYYDNKGLLSECAKILGFQKKQLEEFIGRTLRSHERGPLSLAIANALPSIKK